MEYREIEVRFLEINKEELIQNLLALGASDLGEDMLEEVIIYDKDLAWISTPDWKDRGGKVLRLRTRKGKTVLTYKNNFENSAGGTEEVEFEVGDSKSAEVLLDKLGFSAYRHQQKKRHTFTLGDVVVDIDTWPKVPTYVELEGPSEDHLKATASKLGLDWTKAVFDNPRVLIEKRYKIPLGTMHWFTFDRFE